MEILKLSYSIRELIVEIFVSEKNLNAHSFNIFSTLPCTHFHCRGLIFSLV